MKEYLQNKIKGVNDDPSSSSNGLPTGSLIEKCDTKTKVFSEIELETSKF